MSDEKYKYNLGLATHLKIPEDLGLQIRRTDSIEGIVEEARALGTIKEIEIDERRCLMVFTTVAAAAHTPYVCPYYVFEQVWREKASISNYQSPPNQDLLALKDGKDKNEVSVPLHFITWACVKTKGENNDEVYQELDIFDLVGQGTRYDKEREFALSNLDKDKRESILSSFWQEIERRMVAHDQILRDLYEKGVYPMIRGEIENPNNLTDDFKEKLEALFYDPGLPDHTIPIGHYSQWKKDKLGRGPQSHPSFHSHSVIFFIPEKIWDKINEIQISDDEKKELFNRILAVVNRVLVGGESAWLADLAENNPEIRGKVPELMMKQIDPYSTIFFRAAAESYLLSELESILSEKGIIRDSMKVFIHHTTEKRMGDTRFAEGVKLTITKADLPKFLSGFNQYLNELYQIWEIVKKIVGLKKGDNQVEKNKLLEELEKQFQLPKKLLRLISFIQPVGGTLYDLRVPEFQCFKDFAQKELKGDGDYLGYNIPGVPGFGVTINFKDDKIVEITIGPLLSKKGIGEQVSGTHLIR